jgi:Ca2+-transporting ATPase
VGTNVASADGDLPLTVTQMLWVNLIMDTFAAMALSTISPSVEVMKEKPRANDSFIISHSMLINIVVTGMIFTITLLGVLLYFKEIHGAPTEKDLTIFFTVFVIMQFWNLFNAALFDTRKFISSAIKGNKGLLLVSLIILAGQILIVQFGGKVFRTVPLSLEEWIKIILYTSVVLWIGEIIRGIKKLLYHDRKR